MGSVSVAIHQPIVPDWTSEQKHNRDQSADGGNLAIEIVCEFRVTQAGRTGTPGC
jgi:hypothetical protein